MSPDAEPIDGPNGALRQLGRSVLPVDELDDDRVISILHDMAEDAQHEAAQLHDRARIFELRAAAYRRAAFLLDPDPGE